MTEILSPKRDAAAAAAAAAEAAAWYEDQNNTSRRISFGAGDTQFIAGGLGGDVWDVVYR